MTLKVLFVDDEQNVLQGLRRMMRVVRKDWDMAFAGGGAEALERMAAAPVDVLISDMRMPGMDGAALIAETAKRHPFSLRMVLSGQCEQDATFRLVGTSHQFHCKPCDSERLIAAVRRSVALRDALRDETAQGLVMAAPALPSPPTLRARLDRLLAAGEPPIEPIAELAAADIGLAAKCLQLANSGYFGIGAKVAKPAQAIQLLGSERLGRLIVDYDMIRCQAPDGSQAGAVERIWRRAPACARLARAIAEAEGLAPAAVETAGTAGLLHDAGALLLAANDREPGEQAAAVGAFLAGLWGLPEAIVDAIGLHRAPGRDGSSPFDAATAVHAARALLDERTAAEDALPLDLDHLERLGVAEHLSIWRAEAAAIAAQRADA